MASSVVAFTLTTTTGAPNASLPTSVLKTPTTAAARFPNALKTNATLPMKHSAGGDASSWLPFTGSLGKTETSKGGDASGIPVPFFPYVVFGKTDEKSFVGGDTSAFPAGGIFGKIDLNSTGGDATIFIAMGGDTSAFPAGGIFGKAEAVPT